MTRCLVHTGFAKAGSTFLQEWFERHPQLRFTPHSIGGFSSVFQIADLVQSQPGRRYRYYVTSNELLGSGGNIPYGCALFSFRMLRTANLRQGQADVCGLLHDMFPDARVLIVTRGFSGIIRSLYSQYVKLAGDLDFPRFLEEFRPIFLQWLDVNYNVRLYREAFGRDNVIVWPYEMLRADPVGFLHRLEESLGVEHSTEIPGARNESLSPEKLYWYALASRYIVTPLADRFHPQTAGKIFSLYGFKVVQTGRLDGAIGVLNRIAPRAADLTFPRGYLDAFLGMADSLAGEELYQPYLSEYLIERTLAHAG